jgi:hypothetical protein
LIQVNERGELMTVLEKPTDIQEQIKALSQYAVPKQWDIPGIDWNLETQWQLIQAFAGYYPELPFPEHHNPMNSTRFYYYNDCYSYSDAIYLYAMLRHFQPKRIFEVGAGYTTALMIDTQERFFDYPVDYTVIDPADIRLNRLFKNETKLPFQYLQTRLEKIDPNCFTELCAGDFLFIDSSHQFERGGDLDVIFGKILPLLASGVIIHFHDVFCDFDYPEIWRKRNVKWDEAYYLRTFLQYNHAFEIIGCNSLMVRTFPAFFKEHMPLCAKNAGGSIWLRKR